MKNIKYSNDEMKKINGLYKLVIDDLYQLWEQAPLSEVNCKIDLGDSNPWIIEINDVGVNIHRWETTGRYTYQNIKYHLLAYQKNKLFNKIITHKNLEIPFDIKIAFTTKYKEIKEQLLKAMQKGLKTKEGIKQSLECVEKYINQDATIEIDFPSSINNHEIEVVEENGQKIGTINFGDRTIKIITNGDIVLVNKEKKPVKEKKK